MTLDAMWVALEPQSSPFPSVREVVELMTGLLGRLITILDVISPEGFDRVALRRRE